MRRAITTFLAAAILVFAQDPTPPPAEKSEAPEFFSGSVRSLSATQITVHRKALASNSMTKTFAIDPETRIDGKPRVNGNVTVQYTAGEDGSPRAIHILVR